MLKKMKLLAKRLLNPDYAKLIKDEILDSELALTDKGRRLLDTVLITSGDSPLTSTFIVGELVKIADEHIASREAKKSE